MKKLIIALCTGIFIAVAALVGTSAATYNDIIVNSVDFNPNGMNDVNTDLNDPSGNSISIVEGGTITLDITWVYNPNKNTTPQPIEAFIGSDITSVNAYGHIKFASYHNASYDAQYDGNSNGNVTAIWSNQDTDSPIQNLVVRYLLALADLEHFTSTEDIHGFTLNDVTNYNPLTLSAITAYVNGELVDDTNTLQGTTRTDTFTANSWEFGSGVMNIVVTSTFAVMFDDVVTDSQAYRYGYQDGKQQGYADGYGQGLQIGKQNPDTNSQAYIEQMRAQYDQGYRDALLIERTEVYEQGYLDGQTDMQDVIDMSNLSVEQTGIGAYLAPFNSMWVVAVDVYDWFINNPVGTVIIAVASFVISIGVAYMIIKAVI